MDKRTKSLSKGVNLLERRIADQIDRIDDTLDRSVKNLLRELGRLRELHQALALKREVLHRSYTGDV